MEGTRGERFPTTDGTAIYYREIVPEAPKGRVVVMHGATEHGDRYAHLYAALSGAGYAVVGADWRGHGRSEGLRGHIADFETYVLDTAALLERLAPIEGPRILFAHSMGALVALHYAAERPDDFDGVVLAGPALRLAHPPSATTIRLGRIFSYVFPLFPVRAGIRSDALSHDESVAEEARNDPLMLRRITLRWGREYFRAEERAEGFARRITKPVLALIGDDDGVADPAGADLLREWIPDGLLTLTVFPGLKHELHSEAEDGRAKVFATLLAWLTDRM